MENQDQSVFRKTAIGILLIGCFLILMAFFLFVFLKRFPVSFLIPLLHTHTRADIATAASPRAFALNGHALGRVTVHRIFPHNHAIPKYSMVFLLGLLINYFPTAIPNQKSRSRGKFGLRVIILDPPRASVPKA